MGRIARGMTPRHPSRQSNFEAGFTWAAGMTAIGRANSVGTRPPRTLSSPHKPGWSRGKARLSPALHILGKPWEKKNRPSPNVSAVPHHTTSTKGPECRGGPVRSGFVTPPPAERSRRRKRSSGNRSPRPSTLTLPGDLVEGRRAAQPLRFGINIKLFSELCQGLFPGEFPMALAAGCPCRTGSFCHSLGRLLPSSRIAIPVKAAIQRIK